MTNPVALSFAIVIVSVLLADAFYFHLDILLNARLIIARISEWMAFWR